MLHHGTCCINFCAWSSILLLNVLNRELFANMFKAYQTCAITTSLTGLSFHGSRHLPKPACDFVYGPNLLRNMFNRQSHQCYQYNMTKLELSNAVILAASLHSCALSVYWLKHVYPSPCSSFKCLLSITCVKHHTRVTTCRNMRTLTRYRKLNDILTPYG